MVAATVRRPSPTVALELDGLRLEVNPRVGGRVTSFSLDGQDVLTGADVDADSYGSTFWTSPQSDWDWPPPAEVDRAPYSVADDGDLADALRQPCNALGVRVTKQLSTDRARGAMALKYTIHNDGDTPRRYAPWEVSRVHARGLTFFPSSQPASGTLRVDRVDGAEWHLHDPDAHDARGQKSFGYGAQGFLAHAGRGLLYVKSFADVPSELRAPGEAEVEVYANDRYVEVEVQGPYTLIAPGDCVTWTVRWYLRRLPAHLVARPGNGELLALASSIARGSGSFLRRTDSTPAFRGPRSGA